MNKSKDISWMPLIVIAAAAFIGALDATFMNVAMSQVVIDLDTTVGTIQKMVSFYTFITASLLLISAKLQDIIPEYRQCHLSGCHGIGYDCGRGLDGAGDYFDIIFKEHREAEDWRK